MLEPLKRKWSLVACSSKYTRALTFENLWQADASGMNLMLLRERQVFGLGFRVNGLRTSCCSGSARYS
jgi:hypothetical protein